MAYVSKGRRLMAFVEEAGAIALATNHTLTITPSILEDRTKDDGDAPVGEFDTYTWGITTDSIVGTNDSLSEGNEEASIVNLIDLMLAMEPVNVAFDAALPATGSVPAGGWQAADKANDYPAKHGKAWIESISISAGSSGYATASVSFKGEGDLS